MEPNRPGLQTPSYGAARTVIPPEPAVPPTVGNDALIRRLHPSLRSSDTHGNGGAEVYDGPTSAEAPHWLALLDQLTEQAQAPFLRLNRAWHGHQQAADKDLMRLVPSCGISARHAAEVLRAEIDRLSSTPDRGYGAPTDIRVGRTAWAHAACSVRAESAVCMESATNAAAPQTAARYLAEELTDIAHHAQRIFYDMARHPAFRSWRPVADPLYQQWLDGRLLRATMPPPLYGSREALYEARPGLSLGWAKFTGGKHIVDILPLGSLERYVRDEGGVPWAIIIAVPGYVGDPRGWDERSAALVAAHIPRRASEAFCYLLSEGISSGELLERLRQTRRPMTLEETAAAMTLRI